MPDPKGPGPTVNGHEWIRIAVGRVCQLCMAVQVDGEFDDGLPCEPEHAKASGNEGHAAGREPRL
jgi:hypothetical protein